MPNIEIHGYSRKEARAVHEKVVLSLSRLDCAGEAVVTIYPTKVRDLNGHHQPFLRLVTTPGDFVENVLEVLRSITHNRSRIDIEYLELKDFIPRDEEK